MSLREHAVIWLRRLARPRVIRVLAVVVAAALLVSVAVVAEGFDVKQTPVNDSSVWALQSGTSNRYARINTSLREIDTVKNIDSPSTLVQTPSSVLMLSANDTKVASISQSSPRNIGADSASLKATPSGTQRVTSTGNYVGYLTSDGRVYVAAIGDGAAATTIPVDPYSDASGPAAKRKVYVSDAIAIGTDGILYSYSRTLGTVLRFDIAQAKIVGSDTVPSAPKTAGSTITAVGDNWAILDSTGATLVTKAGASSTGIVGGAVLQQPSAQGQVVYIAGGSALVTIPVGGGKAHTVVGGGAEFGVAAAPTPLGDVMYAGWVGRTETEGTLWSSATGSHPLSYHGQTLSADPTPQFRTNGDRMILNDAQSGWVWTVPNGDLVVTSQDWGVQTQRNDSAADDARRATQISEAKPPVAVDDHFGVRAGSLVSLPVLLNDHDPNKDVLTIVAGSITADGWAKDAVSITNNDQDVSILVPKGAAGAAHFQYVITDGTSKNGLNSTPATVTVTVKPPSVESAPQWCGDVQPSACARPWPTVAVQPGGTAVTPLLDGWVDPEGDPVFIQSVSKQNPDDPGTVAATPQGAVVYQHPSASGGGGTVPVVVTVSDSRGHTTAKTLTVQVTSSPSLVATPFAVTTTPGAAVTVDPSSHLAGVSGSYAITSASTGSTDGSAIRFNQARTSFDFTAAATGSYLVKYTVKDARNEVVALARVTVRARAKSKLSAAPITIFVRPKLDSTVDVLSTVSNPGGKVLLLNAPTYDVASQASLDVSVVDHHLLRVRGTTGDGSPGLLGTVHYTITDGTDTSGGTIEAEATVIELADPREQAPIAVDDTVTVRAGALVNIPVLDNDIAADGSAMILDPKALKNPAKTGLAFVSGSQVRFLAPAKSGTYDLYYGVYSAGTPDLSDSAKITVVVEPAGQNSAPRPQTLEGRVLAGESVSIPFDGFGLDPDGDTVSLDRVVTQPVSGTATIAADGKSILYTSVAGFKGPVQFTYGVVDSRGASATASVHVGVLDAQSDPSPVTFSDYVEVRKGATATSTVYPAANDVDPTGKGLVLKSVVPDAKPDTAEYTSLSALIGEHDSSHVVLKAGTNLGVKSFIYTVADATGNTASGLIVMKVVQSAVADLPQVADSYLALDQRASFATGIDVVTNKVSWQSGDVKNLSLSLVGKPAGITSNGWKIEGTLPTRSELIPFELSGKNSFGDQIKTYGFLQIPGKDDIILALAPGQSAQAVKQKGTVRFDLAKLLALPADEKIIISAAGKFRTTGGRADATCSLVSGTTVSYSAGTSAAPWDDSCTIPLKLVGQTNFTDILVPIAVAPENAVPELVSSAITASPAGGPVTYDLNQMTIWRGAPAWSTLSYSESYAGSLFDVSLSGKTVTVEAHDDATPGRTETIQIGLKTPTGIAPATMTLKVGPAPTTLPQGATVTTTCKVTDSRPCLTRVIGGPGEVNAYGTPLKLVSVDPTSSCPGVSFKKAGNSILASYANSVAGGLCQVAFVVEDAQKNLSSGVRNGSLTVELDGFPLAPDSVQEVAFSDRSLTLSVTPGAAAQAYPALTGFTVKVSGGRGRGSSTSCDPQGNCGAIRTAYNGDKLTYVVVANNKTGSSLSSVSTEAWSYAAPQMGDPTATPVYDSSLTTAQKGVVRITATSTDSTLKGYTITGQDDLVQSTGRTTTVNSQLDVGNRTISVTPVSTIPIPHGNGDTGTTRQLAVAVAGLPTFDGPSGVSEAPTSLTLNGLTPGANYSTLSMQTIYVAYTSGTPRCNVNANGSGLSVSGLNGAQSTSPTISGLSTNTQYSVAACASNGFGAQLSGSKSGITWQQPAAPTGYTYDVGNGSSTGRYAISLTARGTAPSGFKAVFTNWDDASGTASRWGIDPNMSVKYCLLIDTSRCSDSSDITPVAAGRAYQLRVSVSGVVCKAGRNLSVDVNSDQNLGTASVTSAQYDIAGVPTSGTGSVPPGADSVSNIVGTVNFNDDSHTNGLTAYNWHVDGPVDCSN